MQGTLDLLILKALSLAPMHGWGITNRIKQLSRESFRVGQGSLYLALRRHEQRGWVTSYWRTTEHNRVARYYDLTAAGRRDRKSTRLNSSHTVISYAVFCLKKKTKRLDRPSD